MVEGRIVTGQVTASLDGLSREHLSVLREVVVGQLSRMQVGSEPELPLRTDLRSPAHKDYTGFVEDVLHEIRAGNGNLVAERLVRAAADAHTYSRGF